MNQSSFTTPTRHQGQSRRRSMYSPARGPRASPIMNSMGSPTMTYRVPGSPSHCGYSSEASTDSPLMMPRFQTPPRQLPVCSKSTSKQRTKALLKMKRTIKSDRRLPTVDLQCCHSLHCAFVPFCALTGESLPAVANVSLVASPRLRSEASHCC